MRHAEELVTQLRRALMDLHGSKSLPAFARDEYYIGPIYEVTGPKVRPTWRWPESTGARAFVQEDAGVGALVLH